MLPLPICTKTLSINMNKKPASDIVPDAGFIFVLFIDRECVLPAYGRMPARLERSSDLHIPAVDILVKSCEVLHVDLFIAVNIKCGFNYSHVPAVDVLV